MSDFLHDRRHFDQLIAVVADQRGIDPVPLVNEIASLYLT